MTSATSIDVEKQWALATEQLKALRLANDPPVYAATAALAYEIRALALVLVARQT